MGVTLSGDLVELCRSDWAGSICGGATGSFRSGDLIAGDSCLLAECGGVVVLGGGLTVVGSAGGCSTAADGFCT